MKLIICVWIVLLITSCGDPTSEEEKINHVEFDIEAHEENYQKFLESVPEKYSYFYECSFCDAGRVYVTNGVVDSFVKMPVDTTWGYRKEIRTENVQRFSLDSVFGEIHDDFNRYDGIDLNNYDFWVSRINCDYDSVYHYPSKHSYRFEQNPNSKIAYDADFVLLIFDFREENGTVEKADTFDLAVHTENYEKFKDTAPVKYSYLYSYEDETIRCSERIYVTRAEIDSFNTAGDQIDSVVGYEETLKDTNLWSTNPGGLGLPHSIDSVFATFVGYVQENDTLSSDPGAFLHEMQCEYDTIYGYPTSIDHWYRHTYEMDEYNGDIVIDRSIHTFSDFREE